MDHRFLLAAAGIVVIGVVGGAVLAQVGPPTKPAVLAKASVPTMLAPAITPTTKPTAKPAPKPTAKAAKPERLVVNGRVQPARVKVPQRGKGHYSVAAGSGKAREGRGKEIRYLVEVEKGLPFEAGEFADEVHRILNDHRGWGRFKRVASGPVQVRVALSSPRTTDALCRPLRTFGELSCWNGSRAVINASRWAEGTPNYGRDLASYREYLISHEVGHGLGHGHVGCPGPGKPAPVMMQQTKSLASCKPNPWPYPGRLRSEI
ncbi:hypothetical protein GCM10009555_107370 [Acrocarpospora macrocephala]|uniref:DUF3152 domain-containing protein n=1 Tax=Acrocarpospora macrocephala TaxID=150177 RepID=A0A5M3X4K2_9ACTN|nr:DUF3152 domain-containing protein [Acrocarpospora macrocephala]GES15049.1 hypothetical protein Amac_086460 [Acrocarpospora macrocephala]